MQNNNQKVEPFLMSILSGRFAAVTREMANTLLRAGRSTVLNTAKDFSCGITDANSRIVSLAEGLPIHLAAMNLIPRAVTKLFKDDIRPGDVFLNNSPYYGNTHHADFTLCAPVFNGEKLLFFVINRAHHADTGAPLPTTFLPYGKTIFEEGLHFPCIRIQKDYKDIDDVIRMIKYRNRVPDMWYGDYIAQIGSLRVAETRIIEMYNKYGVDTLLRFVDQWQEYGIERMLAEIKKLPKGQWDGEVRHDPVPDLAPEGIPLKAKISIDPDHGFITVDIRDNIDNIPCGFNLSEASTIGGVIVGVLYNLDPTLPHNDGTFSRIRIEMREGAVIGKPRFPIGTSLCTTNVAGRLVSLIQSTMAKMGHPHGIAEGCTSMTAASSVISGTDWRRGRAPYINLLIIPAPGPAMYGHDGWPTAGDAASNGGMFTDSIELDEQRYPMIFDKNELSVDSGGAGQWDGAPAADVIFGPRKDPGTYTWIVDEKFNVAKGVLGGLKGRPGDVYKINTRTGERKDLPPMATMTLTSEERLVSEAPGGAGYGNPLGRDPELVKLRVLEGWISLQRSKAVYGVILNVVDGQYAVDYEETKKLRKRLIKETRQKE